MNPWPHQERCFAELRVVTPKHKRVLVVAPTGCHRIGQGILMGDGQVKPVEDIAIGDLVAGPDSPRGVAALCRGRQQMANVVPVKGESFVVNLDHKLTLVRTNTGKSGPMSQGGVIVDVTVRDWLTWSKTQKHTHKLFRIGAVFEPAAKSPLPIDPYFLGILLGDGAIVSSIAVFKNDREIEDECRAQAARFGLRLRVDEYPGKCKGYYLVGKNGGFPRVKNPIAVLLEGLGLYGHTGATKFIPSAYKTASLDERRAVLAGLMDTDGSLSKNAGFDFISQSERLSRDVVFVARSIGLAAYVNSCEKRDQNGGGGTYWRVSISGNLHEIPTRIPRKKAIARPGGQKKDVLRTGFRIELLDEEDFYGFTLDEHGDGRYLLDDFTVTHNSGKTVCGAMVCSSAVAKGSRVLWVAHTTELVNQPTSVFTVDFGLRVGIIQADRPRDPGALIQVATCQTLARREIDAYDIIVFDEVHLHVGTETAAKIIAANPRAQILGLTATPWRLDGKPMGALFNHIIPLATYAELIAFGILVPSRVFAPPRSQPDLSEVHVVRGEFDKREVEEIVNEPELVGDIVSTYDRNAWTPYGHRQAIVFAHSIAHSIALAKAFRDCGHRAEHLDFRTPTRERERLLDCFKAGEIDVLCNKDILTAGFDHPGLSCVIDASPTMSLARYRQRIGRGMRADVGKRDLLVHDHSSNVFRHGFAHTDREWTLDDARQESPKDSMPSLRTCPKCFAVFDPTPICPACGHVFPVNARELKHRDGKLEEIHSVETDDVRHRRMFFLELCAKAVVLKAGRGFVKAKYRDRFGHAPKFDYPPELPENLGQKRLALERFAQSRGYSGQWVDAEMERRR